MDKQFNDAYEHLQKTLNENDLPHEPGTPSEEEFNKYYDEFQAGKSTVDYIFRNFIVCDGEERQTADDATNELKAETAQALKQELPVSYANKVIQMVNTYYDDPDGAEFIAEKLKPYIANPELADADFTAWQEIFFMAGNDNKSYGQFLTDYED